MPTSDLHPIDALEAAFAGGDESALRDAYEAHGALVFSFCRRSLADDRAEEVTQDVFVSAWRGRDRFDPAKGSLAGWLIGIAKFRIVDNLRAEGRHSDRRSSAEPTDLPVESEIERLADRMLVAEALDLLAPRARKVVELSFLEGLPHAEIAARTSLPLGTVKSDIRRGIETIRRQLGGMA